MMVDNSNIMRIATFLVALPLAGCVTTTRTETPAPKLVDHMVELEGHNISDVAKHLGKPDSVRDWETGRVYIWANTHDRHTKSIMDTGAASAPDPEMLKSRLRCTLQIGTDSGGAIKEFRGWERTPGDCDRYARGLAAAAR